MSEPRKRGRPKGSKNRSTTSTEMYPAGTPLDRHGNPVEDAPIDEETARQIPLDPESARTLQEVKRTRARKSSGEHNVKWNPDNRTKFIQAKEFHPNAYVGFMQLAPVEDHNIDPRHVGTFRDYADLVRYIRETHWKGESATYKWFVYDLGQPQWATGRIELQADPEWRANKLGVPKQEEDMHRRGPNDPYPPHQQQPPPGYGYGAPPYYPPPHPGYPPQYSQPPYPPPPQPQPQQQAPQAAPPPQQPQPQPQQPPMPQPMPPIVLPQGSDQSKTVEMLLGYIERMSQNYSALLAHMESQRWYQHAQQHQPPQQQAPQQHYQQNPQGGQPGVGAPNAYGSQGPHQHGHFTAYREMQMQQRREEQQKSPIDQMKEAVSNMREITGLVRSLADDHSPPDKPTTEEKKEEDFPFAIKELPHMRFVTTKDGQPVDMTTTAMFNGDKLKDFAKGMLEEVDKMIDKRRQYAKEEREAQLEAMREAARLKRELQMGAVQQLPPQQQPPPQPRIVETAPETPPAPPEQQRPGVFQQRRFAPPRVVMSPVGLGKPPAQAQ